MLNNPITTKAMSPGNELLPEFSSRLTVSRLEWERRNRQRLFEPFPVKVRGVDRKGNRFKINTAVENISAGGLYLRLKQRVEPGTVLFVVTQFSSAWKRNARVACVATRGPVLRVESRSGGEYGVAVAITHHRFLQL